MRRRDLLTLAVVLGAASVASGQTTALEFEAESGLILNYIHPDRTTDFERVMLRVSEALSASDEPAHKEIARGWVMFRAREPGPNDSALYVWIMDPAITAQSYSVADILRELLPEDAADLYNSFLESFALG